MKIEISSGDRVNKKIRLEDMEQNVIYTDEQDVFFIKVNDYILRLKDSDIIDHFCLNNWNRTREVRELNNGESLTIKIIK